MIIAALNGGLGNQMFQYAAARALAYKHHTSVVLDVIPLYSKLQFSSLATYRKYELDVFAFQAKTNDMLFKHRYLYPLAKAQFFLNRQLNRFRYNYYRETDFSYHHTLTEQPDNTYLDGHFQSELYFKSAEQLLRMDFEFKHPLTDKNAAWSEKIINTNAVSVHIRRGDYISLSKNLHKHGVTPQSYYEQAVQLIASKVPDPVFFIFTDDTEWVSANMDIPYTSFLVDNNRTAETSWIDMQLMSLCSHNIICNSTFSWWAAWLNRNPEKIVIAPVKWFNDSSLNSKDIYPPEWIKL